MDLLYFCCHIEGGKRAEEPSNTFIYWLISVLINKLVELNANGFLNITNSIILSSQGLKICLPINFHIYTLNLKNPEIMQLQKDTRTNSMMLYFTMLKVSKIQ